MTIVKRLFLLIAFLSFVGICFGQTDFREGYYITWENDTVYGLIDYRAETVNSTHCTFKKEKTSEKVIFTPDDILGYRFIDGKYYVSKMISTSRGEEQVFVEYLLNGITDLYFFNDFENYMYFIEMENGQSFEIKKEIKTINVEGIGDVTVDTRKHIGLLKGVFADCMEIQPKVDKAQLTHKSLISLNREYHDYVCVGEKCIIYEKKPKKIKIQLAPVFGIAFSEHTEGGLFSRFTNDPPTANLSYGGQVNIFAPILNEKLSLQLEVLYNKFDSYSIYRGYYETFISGSVLHRSAAAKYQHNKGKIRPSLALGVAHNLQNNLTIRELVHNIPDQPPVEFFRIPASYGNWGGFVQIGVNYHLFEKIALFSQFKYCLFSNGYKRSAVYLSTGLSFQIL